MNDTGIHLLTEFREKAELLGVAVQRAESPEDAARLVMEWEPLASAGTLIVADELAARSPQLVGALAERRARLAAPVSPATMRDAPVGLSLAALAVAETGSTLLSEPTLGDRSIGMLTLAQVIVVATDALVASLDEAAPALRRYALAGSGAFSTLVTGPSRTADIERVLTVGVQGPGRVMVLFIDNL